MSEVHPRSKTFELRLLVRHYIRANDKFRRQLLRLPEGSTFLLSSQCAALQRELIGCLHEIALPIVHDPDALNSLRGEMKLDHATALELLTHLLMRPQGLSEQRATPLARMTFLAAVEGIQASDLQDHLRERFFRPGLALMREQGTISVPTEKGVISVSIEAEPE